jgi:hypothetical protein
MLRNVTIRVTAQTDGKATVSAYPDGPRTVLYEVPLYKVLVEGLDAKGAAVKKEFKALRFGVQLDAQRKVTSPRIVGLADAQRHQLKWDYITTMKEMAWRVYAGFFIHRGPDDPASSDWGSIGCVEVSGKGEWDRFNQSIADFTGVPVASFATVKTVAASYDAANRPALKKKMR